MKLRTLAFQNVKAGIRNYVSLIFSLAFTVLIVYDFLNLIASGILEQMGEMNARNIEIILQVMVFVLSCFLLFFIWYSTNTFLTKRKKEIGIYVFMGLSNQRIAHLYVLETLWIAVTAFALGILLGVLTSQLFVMIMMKLSDIAVSIRFSFSLAPVALTALVYFLLYAVFVIKGYVSIVRSSVLEMLSAARVNEYVREKSWVLVAKTIAGAVFLGAGYYLAIAKGGAETIGNALLATVFVCAGVYFFFGGFVPLLLQTIAGNKRMLYKKQRNLWINNVIFRMKKNYRTYAMVCILMICSVTALATGAAMKNRYDTIWHFENMYTYQIMSTKPLSEQLRQEFSAAIEKNDTISYSSAVQALLLDASMFDSPFTQQAYMLLPYSQVKELAKDSGLSFPWEELKDDELIDVSHQYVLSIITEDTLADEQINGKTYHTVARTTIPYLGYLQEKASMTIVSDAEYERLRSLGNEASFYNYKVKSPVALEASVQALSSHPQCEGLVKVDPNSTENEWIKTLFSVCVFMFMVFLFASGSVIFMKLYNDAVEEQERYSILKKLGISRKALRSSLSCELRLFYLLPLLVMSVSSYFSVHALANMMQEDLWQVNVISVLVIYLAFWICYRISLRMYQKQIGL